MIKVREFARHGFEEGSGNNNEDKNIWDDPLDVHVDQGSNFRLMSRGPLQYKNVTLDEDIKPIYGNVQVKYPSLIDDYQIDKWQLQDIENIEDIKT